MEWIKKLFTDKRRRGVIHGTYEMGGLIGKIQGFPISEYTATVRLNELKNGMANIDVESTQNVDKEIFIRDLFPNGSWISEKEITWID